MGTRKQKIKNFTFILPLLLFFMAVNVGLAVEPNPTPTLNLGDAFKAKAGDPLNSAASEGAGFNISIDDKAIIGLIIKSVLSLIGVIFLIMAIYGGYIWMMARGNEEMVEKAKNTLTNAIIGLVIVMAAYAISYFVLSQISAKALNDNSQNNNPPSDNSSTFYP